MMHMTIKDFLPTNADILEYDLIMERNKEIGIIYRKFNASIINKNEYMAIKEQILRVYDRKIKDLYDEQKTIMSE